MKKYLIIGLIVLGTAILVIAGYLLRKDGGVTDIPDEEEIILPTENSTSTSGGLGDLIKKTILVSEDPVLNYFIDAKGEITAIHLDGRITRFKQESKEKVENLSANLIPNLAQAKFSWDGKKVLVEMKEPDKKQFSVFDVEKKTWQPLSLEIQAATWAPKDYRLAYFSKKSGVKGALGTMNFSTNNPRQAEIIKINLQEINLEWKKPNELLVVEPASSALESSIWNLDLTKKTLVKVWSNKKGLELLWNKDANQILELTNKQLSLIDEKGQVTRKLGFLTLPSKCFFSEEIIPKTTSTKEIILDFLNCAVSRDQNILKEYALPDDYYKKFIFLEDAIYKINLQNGESKKIFESEGLDAVQLKENEGRIFFLNRYDDKLYSFEVPGA